MVMVQREEDLISAPAAFQSVTSSCSHRHRTLQASVFINSMAPFDPPSTMPKPPGNAPHSAVDWSSLKSLRNQYHKFILSSKKRVLLQPCIFSLPQRQTSLANSQQTPTPAVFKLGSAYQRGSATGSHGVRERIPKSSNCLHGF